MIYFNIRKFCKELGGLFLQKKATSKKLLSIGSEAIKKGRLKAPFFDYLSRVAAAAFSLLALIGVEVALADTNGRGGNFYQLIILNVSNRLL